MKQKLTELQRKQKLLFPIIVDDFNTPLSITDGINRKISKVIKDLSNIIKQLDLNYIYRNKGLKLETNNMKISGKFPKTKKLTHF